MKLELKISLSLKRSKPAETEEEEQFEHRDTDSLVENNGPQRIGFDIPTSDREP